MSEKAAKSVTKTHPGIARWVKAYGIVEFGYCRETRSAIRVLDEGGILWSGRANYKSFDEALADCDANVVRLLRDDYGDKCQASLRAH